ncbi:Ethylmalonyl-coa decarboxylase, partial [Globisporangium splendens]
MIAATCAFSHRHMSRSCVRSAAARLHVALTRRQRTSLSPSHTPQHLASFSIVVRRCASTNASRAQQIDFDAMPNLFAFVTELAHDKPALVAQCRETLRQMGRDDDSIRLLLPSDDGDALKSSIDAFGLEDLTKVAVIEIHNPSARNALSGKMMAELADVVTRLEDPQVHSKLNTVILKGTGGWFCAGADLRVAQKQLTSNEAGTAMGVLMVDTLTRFRRLPLVSFAIIEGGAYGGGAELTTSCDYRLIEGNAIVQFVQARMGVSPGWGGGARLCKLVGRQHALRLLCTAAKTSPEEALRLGLADLVFYADTEAKDKLIHEFVSPFDAIASEVLHGQKKVIASADDVNLDELVDYEHSVFRSLWGGPANLQALDSFKRKSSSSETKASP